MFVTRRFILTTEKDMALHNFRLTEEQIDWFGNRMHDSPAGTGRVVVPKYLKVKLRKISGEIEATDYELHSYLIQYCYL